MNGLQPQRGAAKFSSSQALSQSESDSAFGIVQVKNKSERNSMAREAFRSGAIRKSTMDAIINGTFNKPKVNRPLPTFN